MPKGNAFFSGLKICALRFCFHRGNFRSSTRPQSLEKLICLLTIGAVNLWFVTVRYHWELMLQTCCFCAPLPQDLFAMVTEAFYRTIHERTPLMASMEQDDAYQHSTHDQYYSPEGEARMRCCWDGFPPPSNQGRLSASRTSRNHLSSFD